MTESTEFGTVTKAGDDDVKPLGRFSDSTIRAMLSNERYLGKWVWNKRKWVPVPGKKAKRALRRPPTEWVTKEVPELAIVTQELWDHVRARQSARKAASKGRAPGEATATPYLLVSTAPVFGDITGSKSHGAHAAGSEAAAFLIGEGDHLNGALRIYSEIFERFENLECRKRSQCSIKPAA